MREEEQRGQSEEQFGKGHFCVDGRVEVRCDELGEKYVVDEEAHRSCQRFYEQICFVYRIVGTVVGDEFVVDCQWRYDEF